MNHDKLSRRSLLAGGLAIGASIGRPAWAQMTTSLKTPEEFRPTVVKLDADFPAGELHVLPNQFRLYWTLTQREAIRFTVGVGRPGLYHEGRFWVGDKKEWPSWRPTSEMIERNPEAYAKYADGMPGGPDNPLGARALYLYDQAGRDTMLRIHGTNDPRTIGTAVSNGCARLTNEDIQVLYGGVDIGTRVFLHPQDTPSAASSPDVSVVPVVDSIGPTPQEVVSERNPVPVPVWPRGGR